MNKIGQGNEIERNVTRAAGRKDWDEVQRLVEQGEDVNNVDEEWKSTALHFASEYGNADICLLLLSRGANVSPTDKNGNTPLHLAAACYYVDICQLLVDHKADVTSVNNKGQTPLHTAVLEWHKSPTLCCPLITNESVNVADHHGNCALHIAARNGDIQTVQLLVDCRADVNALNEDGQTPLHTAAGGEKDCPELCSILLEHNAKIDAVDKDGNQPLHLACKRLNSKTRQLLLNHNADANVLNNNKYKPWHLASQRLVSSYTKAIDGDGSNALHKVAESADLHAIQLLLDWGADVNEVNEDRQTPLHTAAGRWQDCPELCAILLKSNAKIDAVDKRGRQPLHLACEHDNLATATLLLSLGADVTVLNKKQREYLGLANESTVKSGQEQNSKYTADRKYYIN